MKRNAAVGASFRHFGRATRSSQCPSARSTPRATHFFGPPRSRETSSPCGVGRSIANLLNHAAASLDCENVPVSAPAPKHFIDAALRPHCVWPDRGGKPEPAGRAHALRAHSRSLPGHRGCALRWIGIRRSEAEGTEPVRATRTGRYAGSARQRLPRQRSSVAGCTG